MDNVFIGSGTTILGNVRIGPNAIIAAGSVVNRDVPPDSIVGGVPAKVIGKFSDLIEKRKHDEYPREMRPTKQDVSPQLVEHLWNQFEKSHESNNSKQQR